MQGFGDMGKRRIHQFGLGFLLTVMIVLASVLTALAVAQDAAVPQQGSADIVAIDGLKAFGPLERPPVYFYHDKHTEVLAKQNKDCLACHEKVEDRLSLKFKRVEDPDKQTVMDIYHDQCITCHKENKTSETPNGPVTCGQCHIEGASPQSTWQPIGLDKSLHYRHVKANEKKCERCHHEYNPQTKKLFYAKGKEGACLYCHKDVAEENRMANRPASHLACVGCHRQLTAKNKDAGPMQCAGCHDPKQQALIEKVTDIPRMERNQPDVVLVKTAPDNDPQNVPANRMLPVPFSHKDHEGYNNSCRQCHHASLAACASCHSVQGSDDGKQVKLAQAMHQRDADMSCVGCHNKQQDLPQCAGCHSSIAGGKSLTTDASCRTCHMSSMAENPYPTGDAETKAAAAELLAARQPITGTVTLDQIPENVTIKLLVDQYEAATFPHRKIVLKLAEGMKDNRLAANFHTELTTLCQGCHHNSPASIKPPQCGSCHGRSSEALNLTRPGLMAAYHQQCIQCHDKMGLKKPASRECTACHAKRK